MTAGRIIDEGPSPEDIRRFDRRGETGYCPACGAEVWDIADVCPACGEYLTEGPTRRPPLERSFRQKWIVLVVALMILALLLFLLL